MKTLLWLDDIRNPLEDNWLVFSPIDQPYNVIWVKSHQEFIDWINLNSLPDAICFDHDLGHNVASEARTKGLNKKKARLLASQEKTGFDSAKWLVNYCLDNELKLPLYNIQSANPVGKENINSLLKQFNKLSN